MRTSRNSWGGQSSASATLVYIRAHLESPGCGRDTLGQTAVQLHPDFMATVSSGPSGQLRAHRRLRAGRARWSVEIDGVEVRVPFSTADRGPGSGQHRAQPHSSPPRSAPRTATPSSPFSTADSDTDIPVQHRGQRRRPPFSTADSGLPRRPRGSSILQKHPSKRPDRPLLPLLSLVIPPAAPPAISPLLSPPASSPLPVKPLLLPHQAPVKGSCCPASLPAALLLH